MLFNSLSFLAFFPIVTAGYFLLPQGVRWAWLLVASSVFYMAFVPEYILILLATIVVDYFAGIAIERASGSRRRWLLVASLCANIGALAVFKYYGFFRENVLALTNLLGLGISPPALDIILPIGLSFHTFQAMSYTIEVYRGHQPAERHFGIYALYVMFYPQLVAGPIERPQNLLRQFRETHAFDYDRVVAGLKLMAVGMFKKVVVADGLAGVVDKVYANPTEYHGPALAIATLFFAFQIYFDFAGYSEIALGAAHVMGFRLMKNFDTPYFSASLAEFWRRWHISLSTWFRDYVYVPLGGNRASKLSRYRNLSIVFLISGLWHGASWTYVVWGAVHAVGLIASDALRGARERIALPRALSVAATFAFVTFAWIFFRARTFDDAWYVTSHLFTRGPELFDDLKVGELWLPALIVVATLLVENADKHGGLFERLARRPAPVRFAFYFVLTYSCLWFGSIHAKQQFIYFQF